MFIRSTISLLVFLAIILFPLRLLMVPATVQSISSGNYPINKPANRYVETVISVKLSAMMEIQLVEMDALVYAKHRAITVASRQESFPLLSASLKPKFSFLSSQ